MAKEQLQKLNELAEKRVAISGIISQNERLKTNVDAKLGQGGFTLPKKYVMPGSPIEQAIQVGRFNKNKKDTESRLKEKITLSTEREEEKLREVDQEIESLAPVYVAGLKMMTDEITELSELAADPDSGIDTEVFEMYHKEYTDFASLPDKVPSLKRGIEKLESQPEESEEDSVTPGKLIDEVQPPHFPIEHINTGKPETEQALPKLKVKKGKKVIITNETGDKSISMRQNSHQFAVLNLLLSSPNEAINILDIADLLRSRGSTAHERYMVMGLNRKLEEIYPDIDLITEESMGYSNTYHHYGFKLNADVELVEPIAHAQPPQDELPESQPTPTPTEGKKGWLDEYHRDSVEESESEKTKVKIQLLPDNQLKIGERIIKLSSKLYEGQKDYSSERIKALKVLVERQGEMLSPHEIWEIAFPAQNFDRQKMVQIKAWLDNNITYHNKKIVSHNGKRGLGSRYGITEFDVELIKPGKSIKSAPTPTQKSDAGEKPVEPALHLETTALVEDRTTKLIPTIEEAALLVGYFSFRDDIFQELGINPPPDYLCDKLDHALGGKNGRTEEDILELRKSGLQKAKALLEENLLDKAILELSDNNPVIDFLIYLLDIENQRIEHTQDVMMNEEPLSALQFIELIIDAHSNLSSNLNIKTYRIGQETEMQFVSNTGKVIYSRRLGEGSIDETDITSEPDGTIISVSTTTEELHSRHTTKTEITVFDPDVKVAQEDVDQPDIPKAVAQPDPELSAVRQKSHGELAAEFLASEAAKQKDKSGERAVIDEFAQDIEIFYEQLGGLDPEGVNISTFLGRFPHIQKTDIVNAFENNIISENTKGGQGGTLLNHESMVRILFHKETRGVYSAKPFNKLLEKAYRKVRKEKEKEAAEKAARGDEDNYIEG